MARAISIAMFQILFLLATLASAERVVIERAHGPFVEDLPSRVIRTYHSEFTAHAKSPVAPIIWDHVDQWFRLREIDQDLGRARVDLREAWQMTLERLDVHNVNQAIRTRLRVTPLTRDTARVEIDRVGYTQDGLAPKLPRSMRPALLEALLDDPRIQLWAGSMPLLAVPLVADETTARAVLAMIHDPERRQPLVFASSYSRTGGPMIDATALARRLRGHASVVVERGQDHFPVSEVISRDLEMAADGRVYIFGLTDAFKGIAPWLENDEIRLHARLSGSVMQLIKAGLRSRGFCKQFIVSDGSIFENQRSPTDL